MVPTRTGNCLHLKRKAIYAVQTVSICIFIPSCTSFSTVDRLGYNYYAVTFSHSSMSEPQAHRTALRYQEPDGKWLRNGAVTVWPSVNLIQVTNGMVLFTGDTAGSSVQHDDDSPIKERLFAHRFPGPPVDITREVLANRTRTSGTNSVGDTRRAQISSLECRNEGVVIHFVFYAPPEWPAATVNVEWHQLENIIRDVTENGVSRKDITWGATYVEKASAPEAQNK